MTIVQDPILVDIFQDVTNSIVLPGYVVDYQPGRSINILDNLNELDNSITMKGLKYPLLAVKLPIREQRGKGYYSTTIIERIVLANQVLTVDNSEYIIEKYAETGNYKKVLYPLYREFFLRLAMHPMVVGFDPNSFIHTKMDNPGQQKLGQGFTDYVDSIEILNLELTTTQIKNCI